MKINYNFDGHNRHYAFCWQPAMFSYIYILRLVAVVFVFHIISVICMAKQDTCSNEHGVCPMPL